MHSAIEEMSYLCFLLAIFSLRDLFRDDGSGNSDDRRSPIFFVSIRKAPPHIYHFGSMRTSCYCRTFLSQFLFYRIRG